MFRLVVDHNLRYRQRHPHDLAAWVTLTTRHWCGAGRLVDLRVPMPSAAQPLRAARSVSWSGESHRERNVRLVFSRCRVSE